MYVVTININDKHPTPSKIFVINMIIAIPSSSVELGHVALDDNKIELLHVYDV